MDAITAQFLADTLRPYSPDVPKAYDPSIYQNQGFNVANQIDSQIEAGQHIAATDQATALAAAQAPYNTALLKAKADAIPLDKKYNASIQASQADLYRARADDATADAAFKRSRADQLGKPFTPDAFVPDYGNGGATGASDGSTPAVPSTIQASDALPTDDDDDETGASPTLFGAGTGAVSGAPSAPVSNVSAPDENGFHSTVATTFATPSDLADYKKNKSLATGDNGVGAWGDDTTGEMPFVALPPSFLKANGINPDTARGTPVTVSANGRTVQAVVGDKMPDHSPNGAGLDMNPATAAGLGIADVNDFKGHVQFKLGHDVATPDDSLSAAAATPLVAGIPGTSDDSSLDSILAGPLAPVSGAYQPGDPGYVGPTENKAKSDGGIRVPKTDAEAEAFRNSFNNYAQSQANNSDPRMKAYLAGLNQRVQETLSQYYRNRSFTARQQAAQGRAKAGGGSDAPGALTATDPGTGLPVLPGFVPSDIAVSPKGGISYKQKSPNDVEDEKKQANDAALVRLSQQVARDTHGGTLEDLLNDRGNYLDTPPDASGQTHAGKVTPGTHYYMQAVEDPDTHQRVLKEMPMSEGQYNRYRKQMAALGYGTVGDDAVPSPAAAPTFMMSNMLGPNGTVTPDVPTAASTPPAAAPVPPATDPTIRLTALRQSQADSEAARQKLGLGPTAGTQSQGDIDDESDATQEAIKESQKYDTDQTTQKQNVQTAHAIADKFDFDSIKRPFLVNNDGTVTAPANMADVIGSSANRDNTYAYDPLSFSKPGDAALVTQKIAEAAKAAGIKKYDVGTVVKTLRARRAQAALDDLLPQADPDVLNNANTLAAQMQARQSSLPTGFGTSSVGATDRIIPNSGTR